MAVLPISRNVRVTLTRQNRFATRRGFGVPMLLTSATVAGVLDASKPVFYAASLEEVAVHWDAGEAPYDAALAAGSERTSTFSCRQRWRSKLPVFTIACGSM